MKHFDIWLEYSITGEIEDEFSDDLLLEMIKDCIGEAFDKFYQTETRLSRETLDSLMVFESGDDIVSYPIEEE